MPPSQMSLPQLLGLVFFFSSRSRKHILIPRSLFQAILASQPLGFILGQLSTQSVANMIIPDRFAIYLPDQQQSSRLCA